MAAGGYFLSAALLGTGNQPGIFFTLYTFSLLFVVLFMSGHQAAAFVLVGFAGTVAEALLLSPSINYYEFAHKELFGRAPSWLPFVYGWVGVFIHRISRGIGRERPGGSPLPQLLFQHFVHEGRVGLPAGWLS